jgi:hypothetical protein
LFFDVVPIWELFGMAGDLVPGPRGAILGPGRVVRRGPGGPGTNKKQSTNTINTTQKYKIDFYFV